VDNLISSFGEVASATMDDSIVSEQLVRFVRTGRALPSRLWSYYGSLLRSRQQWVGVASQSFFFNPYLAAMDMLIVHPGAVHGAISRCWALFWSALGTTGLYSNGRDELFKRLGLLAPSSSKHFLTAIVADTAYGFILNLPGFVINYALSGCGSASILLGIKACAAVCWTSSISGGLFDTFNALDSDDPQKKSRVPIVVRWLVIDRFGLETRKKFIWACLTASLAATVAIYCFAPGGILR
jgi:hypothetical protein